MGLETLVEGYRHVMNTLYSPRHYYERVRVFLKEYRPSQKTGVRRLKTSQIKGFVKTLWLLGVVDRGRKYYWKLFFTTLFRKPRAFPLAMSLSVFGYHFRKVAEKTLRTPQVQTGISGAASGARP
jgi:hypothetical protein